MPDIKLIDCPRDAMQGVKEFIPTDLKAEYINSLLQVGFDTLDFGSFVSPKAIPQMQDTTALLNKLDLSATKTKLLAIIANVRGAEEAALHEEIAYLGFPLSISETFQQRNTNKSIAQAFDEVKAIHEICIKNGKTLVVYLSMGFGNPYGDPYSPQLVVDFTAQLHTIGVKIVALSDTIGIANPALITSLFTQLIPAYPDIEFGAHMHSTPEKVTEKITAAAEAGCKRFDGALKGYGGCPMAADELTGNMPSEQLIAYFNYNLPSINQVALNQSLALAGKVFSHT